MPRLIVTAGALADLERCRAHLAERSLPAAERAGRAIAQRLRQLESTPQMGRPTGLPHDFRELVIPFGESGYVALYRYDPEAGVVHLLALRHQREAGFT